MILQVGSYAFPSGECDVRARSETLIAGGKPYGYRRIFDIEGRIYVNGQADATTKQNALVAALNTPFQDIVLLNDDSSKSAVLLQNAGSISGVLITRGPHFEKNFGAELATIRSVSFTAEAEYPNPGSQLLFLSFSESLSFRGGGINAKTIFRPNLIGPFQKQLVYTQIPYRVTQRGQASGYRGYPTPPLPIWPNDEHQDLRDIQFTAPQRVGPSQTSYEGWRVSWSYEFESVNPFVGAPNLWPQSN